MSRVSQRPADDDRGDCDGFDFDKAAQAFNLVNVELDIINEIDFAFFLDDREDL